MEVLYLHDEVVHNFNAAKEVLPFLLNRFKPKSIVDIGCGIATWLAVAKDLGIKDIAGVDGAYVDRTLLKIKEEEFVEKDLRLPFSLNRKFDLLLCLEVAEHLPESSSDVFVHSLCQHSDIIIFSAAIPGQGGQFHLNEQWPQYWIDKFYKNDFVCEDSIRPLFWDNENIECWYRQNMLLFKKKSAINDKQKVMAYVHPELFEAKEQQIKHLERKIHQLEYKPGVKDSARKLLQALKRKILG
jgi:SAM-dependent methyltransferase